MGDALRNADSPRTFRPAATTKEQGTDLETDLDRIIQDDSDS